MNKLVEEITHCTNCFLGEFRERQCWFAVPGQGNINANLMFVGEAPGRQEAETGSPFVGRAGKLLDKMIAHCFGLTRDDVFITNTVKCRPPNNRDPLPEELAACVGYLEQQITIVQPNVIVALGKVSAKLLGGLDGRVKDFRGRPTLIKINHKPFYLVATTHPAYWLRNPRDKIQVEKDMKIVEEIQAKSAN